MGNYQEGTDSEKPLVFVKTQAITKTLFWPVCLSDQVCREEFCGENLWQHNFCESWRIEDFPIHKVPVDTCRTVTRVRNRSPPFPAGLRIDQEKMAPMYSKYMT